MNESLTQKQYSVLDDKWFGLEMKKNGRLQSAEIHFGKIMITTMKYKKYYSGYCWLAYDVYSMHCGNVILQDNNDYL